MGNGCGGSLAVLKICICFFKPHNPVLSALFCSFFAQKHLNFCSFFDFCAVVDRESNSYYNNIE